MAVAQMTREDENFLNRYELEGNVLINLRPAMLKMLMCKFLHISNHVLMSMMSKYP